MHGFTLNIWINVTVVALVVLNNTQTMVKGFESTTHNATVTLFSGLKKYLQI